MFGNEVGCFGGDWIARDQVPSVMVSSNSDPFPAELQIHRNQPLEAEQLASFSWKIQVWEVQLGKS